jgi:hypothetical protein
VDLHRFGPVATLAGLLRQLLHLKALDLDRLRESHPEPFFPGFADRPLAANWHLAIRNPPCLIRVFVESHFCPIKVRWIDGADRRKVPRRNWLTANLFIRSAVIVREEAEVRNAPRALVGLRGCTRTRLETIQSAID